MSSILEALKKLEDEKAARRGGSGNLTGKVARTGQRPRTTPAWLIPGVMLAVAAVSVLGTYIMMSRTPPPRTGPSTLQLHGDAAPSPAGQPPATQLPAVATPVTDALNPRQPSPRPEAAKPGNSVRPRKITAPADDPAKRAEPLPAGPGKSSSANSGGHLPDLTVVGIAWQKDSALRLAIVNGMPVREGGVVSGATVREILPDRVRFSINGKEFDYAIDN